MDISIRHYEFGRLPIHGKECLNTQHSHVCKKEIVDRLCSFEIRPDDHHRADRSSITWSNWHILLCELPGCGKFIGPIFTQLICRIKTLSYLYKTTFSSISLLRLRHLTSMWAFTLGFRSWYSNAFLCISIPKITDVLLVLGIEDRKVCFCCQRCSSIPNPKKRVPSVECSHPTTLSLIQNLTVDRMATIVYKGLSITGCIYFQSSLIPPTNTKSMLRLRPESQLAFFNLKPPKPTALLCVDNYTAITIYIVLRYFTYLGTLGTVVIDLWLWDLSPLKFRLIHYADGARPKVFTYDPLVGS